MTAPGGEFDTSWFAGGGFYGALESSPDSILVLDLAGVVQFVNANGVALLSARGGALVGTSWLTLWAEPDRPAAQAAIATASDGEIQRFRAPVATRTGGLRRLDNIVSPLRDAAGAPVAVLITSRDVTDLEDARLASEARERTAIQEASVLRSVAEMAYLTSWEFDFRLNLVRVGEAGVQAMHGGPEHRELTIEQALAVFSPEDQVRMQDMLERARLYGEPFRFDAPVTRHDGTRGWVRQFGEPIFVDGVCVGIRGAGMDISDEMEARETIERAEQRLNLAVQLAGMEVYELDFERSVVTQAGPSSKIFEVAVRDEDLWPDPMNQVDPRDRARVQAAWAKAEEAQTPFRCEYRVNGPDGREVWVYGVAEVVGAGERPRRVVTAIMDITERKRSELETLQAMAQMREHEERQKLLLDELNHRVKNTLAAVQSVAMQTLTGARDPQEGRDLFIERLLALSTTHDLLVKHAWTSASFRELVQTALKPYGMAYHYEGPDLRIDPNFAVSLGMALHELATNALKYGAWLKDGQVNIATAIHGSEARIIWRESGGPPVSSPTRRGFGSRLLQRGVAGELGGKVVLDFLPGGVVCSVHAPTSDRLYAVDADNVLRRGVAEGIAEPVQS